MRDGVMRFRRLIVVAATAIAAGLSGCADNKGNGDPGARALPVGSSCESIKSELNRLDAKGVPSRIESAQAGHKLAGPQQAEVEQYNRLLSDYLGARCHVPPGH